MPSPSPSPSEPSEYIALPSGDRDSPELQAARELDTLAQDAQGRLKLGCFIFWLSEHSYLMTALPPMGDVLGSDTVMTIYTAEHTVTVRGKNLHLLVWAMKHQRVDALRATESEDDNEDGTEWVIHSITAEAREDE